MGSSALALYERYLALTPAGDAKVGKWVADLKNRQARMEERMKRMQQDGARR